MSYQRFYQGMGDGPFDALLQIGSAVKDAAAGAISMFTSGPTPIVLPPLDVHGTGAGSPAKTKTGGVLQPGSPAAKAAAGGQPAWLIPAVVVGAGGLAYLLLRKRKR